MHNQANVQAGGVGVVGYGMSTQYTYTIRKVSNGYVVSQYAYTGQLGGNTTELIFKSREDLISWLDKTI